MHDIHYIKQNQKLFDQHLIRRGLEPVSEKLIKIYDDTLNIQHQLQNFQEKKNKLAKTIAFHKKNNKDATTILSEAEKVKNSIHTLEEKYSKLKNILSDKLSSLPNILEDDVPLGDESNNLEIKKIGQVTNLDFVPKSHEILAQNLNGLDSVLAAKISGSRFSILKKDIARLERAIINFFLDKHIENGYQEVSVPHLVTEKSMYGSSQLPKFENDAYKTLDNMYLIPTSEVVLCNFVQDKLLEEIELPVRLTAHTQCYRREAGSAGKDMHGLIRQHQFSKVELVSITRPQESKKELENTVEYASSLLKILDIPHRIILLASKDTSFASTKTYDIEVWLPSPKKYCEISSCSNCLDFQARRMKARYKEMNSKKNLFVHTLNASGLAVGRTIVAILENYQNSDGSVAIPKALQKYMNKLPLLK